MAFLRLVIFTLFIATAVMTSPVVNDENLNSETINKPVNGNGVLDNESKNMYRSIRSPTTARPIDEYIILNDRLNNLEKELLHRVKSLEKQFLIREIVQDVRSNNFKLVHEKISNVDIAKIVHEIYANSEKNFDVLINLAEVLPDFNQRFEVLKSLHNEMEITNNQSSIVNPKYLQDLIVLSKKLELEEHSVNNTEIKQKLSAIIDGIKDTLERNITALLTNYLGTTDYRYMKEIHVLAKEFYIYQPKISDKMMQSLIDNIYKTSSHELIINNLFKYHNVTPAIFGITYLFWKLKESDELNDKVILNIASKLGSLMDSREYADFNDNAKEQIELVIENIPVCARNLFFKPTVCLWNKGHDSYLQVSGIYHNHDRERRNIFTWKPKGNESQEIPAGISWFVERDGDRVLFKSKKYPNEYLYAAQFNYNPQMRYLFNWIPGGNTDDQSAFSVELDGDYCRLKSARFNEYLLASDIKFTRDTRYSYVFTWTPGSFESSDDYVWQIRSC